MYYPLLKNNNNEMKALRNLKEDSRSKLIPIIESKRIKPENINNWESTFNTLGSYLGERLENIKFIYDFNTTLDDLGSDEEFLNTKNQNLVTFCIEKMEDKNLDFIPCFQHDSPSWIIKTIFEHDFKEIAIRVRCHDFKEPLDELVMQNLLKIINTSEVSAKFTIILDFYNLPATLSRIQNAINTFQNIPHSNMVYVATACPEDASKTKSHSINLVGPRNELNMYLELKKKNLHLLFGDYTTRLKGKILSGFNNDNSYIKIFYSSESDYYIVKSKMIKNDGEDSFYEVCQELIEQDFYPGEGFSFGDNEIKKCADKKITISGHQTPIAIGVNHHIETTINQLLG
ncbi:hypothetical protein CSE16_12000 [Solibacillus sp. R5-41]|uniref:beta family protein n=1 Tax=Solibacillus sp. R5-41 TaxID=2048654 RepID=UPI000C126998|nr:hypothetical protein [Solibacillus sp. R5-41]ATP40712.1 hypothetical protein CSE16_12000 [Solibacillus sp. R5-41]